MTDKDSKLLGKLLGWLRDEHDRQNENRIEMALDEDYYDGIQWTSEEIEVLKSRGQAPLVYNEIKIAIDWVLGSEKRNRMDWRVMPRTEDDVELAEVKTKLMKYISDVNKVPFVRSTAFKQAAVAGLGWIDDGLNMDASAEILFSGAESWRNILHDSYDRSVDGSGMRYIFRWRDLDLDVAQKMFPKCKDELARASYSGDHPNDELWYIGDPLRVRTHSDIMGDRQRVRVYECQYRLPEMATVVRGDRFRGEIYDPNDQTHIASIEAGEATVHRGIVMKTYVAHFLPTKLLGSYPSPFKHNQFSLTPIYCYRRAWDNQPYGMVRQMRDPQSDLNKRMSKMLYLLSVNQIITEQGAFNERGEYTLADAVEAVQRPDGVVVMRDGGKRFDIRRDYNEMSGQQAMVSLDRQFLQSTSGVTDELLGRVTNATSGRAVLARQEQGSLTTAGLFDAYRVAIQTSGQKLLSLAEQYYTLPKVIRLTDPTSKGAIEWVRINTPEVQADGTVRFLNDITASSADFIVDEQDFRSTMRQTMFDALNDMIGRIAPLNPTFAISLLDLLVDVADFPGKEAFVERLRILIAEARGELPHQQEAAAASAQIEQAAVEAQIAKAMGEARDKQTEGDLNLARAQKAMAEAQAIIPTQAAPPPQFAGAPPPAQVDGAASQLGEWFAPPPMQEPPPMGQPTPMGQPHPMGQPPPMGQPTPMWQPTPMGQPMQYPMQAPMPAPMPASMQAQPQAPDPKIDLLAQQVAEMAASLERLAAAVGSRLENVTAGVASALEEVASAVEDTKPLEAIVERAVKQSEESIKEAMEEPPVKQVEIVAGGKKLSATVTRDAGGKKVEITGRDGRKISATIRPKEKS